jgi:small subunit ribosomal protein S6
VREYETTVIIQPEISDEAVQEFCDRLDGIVEKGDSVRLMYDDQGRRRLAYEIQSFQKGRYLMLHFLDEGGVIPALERVLRLDDSVLRFLTVQVDDDVTDIEARKAEAAEAVRIREQRAAERAAREAEEAAARAVREAEEAAAETARAAEAAAASANEAEEAAAASANEAEEATAASANEAEEATAADDADAGDEADVTDAAEASKASKAESSGDAGDESGDDADDDEKEA